jgi:hypothetical protein
MKRRIYATISLIIAICLLTLFFILNFNARNKFVKYNYSTSSHPYLKKVKYKNPFTLSFNKYFHIDSIQIHNEQGYQVLNIPTICNYLEDTDFSEINAENYGMTSPFSIYPFDEKQAKIVNAIEKIVNINYPQYKIIYPNATVYDYLMFLSTELYYKDIYKPILRKLFAHRLYVKSISDESIIKALTINQAGTIKIIHLYNGMKLFLNNYFTDTNELTYETLFQASIDENAEQELIESYIHRLSRNSLFNYKNRASKLAQQHIEEIKRTLSSEKILVLCTEEDFIWDSDIDTRYPYWIENLLISGILFSLLSIILFIGSHNTKKTNQGNI